MLPSLKTLTATAGAFLLAGGLAVGSSSSVLAAAPAKAAATTATTPAKAPAATTAAATTLVPTAPTASVLTEDELEKLVAPIALYPDDLVSLIVAAAIYPVQVIEAQRFLDQNKTKPDLKPSDKWDGSVVALLNYPTVVKMMSDDLTWTQQLGDAVVNQQDDLLTAIQQLRDVADAKGVLETTDKVTVEKKNDNIIINSVDPEQIYIPVYEPQMFYEPGYVWPTHLAYNDYCSYYYPTCSWWPGFTTGWFWGSWIDWDHGGWWGGDIDVDIDNDWDFDFDFNFDRDRPHVDHHDLRNLDRSKLADKDFKIDPGKIDRGKIEQGLRNNPDNRIASKVKDRPSSANKLGAGNIQGRDVRNSVATGLAAGAAGAAVAGNRKSLPASGNKVAGGATPKAGNKVAAGGAKPAAANKIAQGGGKKPGATAANRSKTPSALGSPSAGRVATTQSNRGQVSRGSYGSRGGPTASFSSRGGGGGAGISRGGGGGGRGGGGGGGGGRGGGGGGRR